ncbi:MAG TPA: hypothetical protein VJN01_00365 [Xanthomonadales bacterium]|nr:hypothetical protein [Xanthomonadales bacterium]
MSLAVDSTAVAASAATARSPIASRQSSKILPSLFERLQDRSDRQCLNVLEVGRALPETVRFFSSIRCRIHVADLFEELRSGRLDRTASGKTLERTFQEQLAFQAGTQLDVCLLWDFPHYLDEKQLRAFSRALWPWMHAGTRAFVFGVHSAATPLLNREYGIFDAQTISVRPRNGEALPCNPHPQSFLNEWLTCLSVSKGILLPDGKVECLMHPRN